MGAKTSRTMIGEGQSAPPFNLNDLTGTAAALEEVLKDGPALLAFFKVSCPTCQLTLPFLDRINGKSLRVLGVSQDDAGDSKAFASRYGLHFTTLVDPAAAGYKVSCAYGIAVVPSLFLIERDGRVSKSWTGFSRKDMEWLASKADAAPMFRPGEYAPEWKAG